MSAAPSTVSRPARTLLDLALVGGALYAALFVIVAVARAPFGFELEWMEGGMVSHAARLLDGQPIYTAPSADFVPFFYTPGYPLTLAGLATITGSLTLALGRAVSIAATLLTFGFLFRVGQREAGWRYGLLAMGLYAALFRTTGAFYDLARPDALFIALVAAGTYVAFYRRSGLGALAAGAIFAAAFFTKQTSTVFVPAVALYLLWRDWRHALGFGAAAFGLAAAGVFVGVELTDGWMWTYIFEGHQGHLFYWKNILLEYWRDVLFVAPLVLLLPLLWFGYKVPVVILSVFLAAHWTYAFIFRASGFADFPHMYYRELWYLEPRWALFVPPALIALLLGLFRALNHRPMRPPTHGFWLLMFVAGAGSSALNHSTQWAYSNSLMPIALFAAALVPLVVRDLITHRPVVGTRDGIRDDSDAIGWHPRWSALVPLAVLVQLVAWIYDPRAQVPDAADEAALARLEARLAQVEGKVFFPAHPLYAWHRDGRVHTHQMGIQDVAFMGGVGDLAARLRAREWAAVIVDERNRVPGLERSYYVGERFRYEGDALKTRTGFLVRPGVLWLADDPVERTLADGLSANFEAEASGAAPESWDAIGWHATGDAFGDRPSRRGQRGRQGRAAAISTARGTGALVSGPFEATAGRLTLLVGGRGDVEVAVEADGRTIARHRPRSGRTLTLDRVSLDISAARGRPIRVRVEDRDREGLVAVDDLRLVD